RARRHRPTAVNEKLRTQNSHLNFRFPDGPTQRGRAATDKNPKCKIHNSEQQPRTTEGRRNWRIGTQGVDIVAPPKDSEVSSAGFRGVDTNEKIGVAARKFLRSEFCVLSSA
ncbi:MAG: hypothetical protein ACRD6I_07405, partial [Candidatus Acidiferrales bacterium]